MLFSTSHHAAVPAQCQKLPVKSGTLANIDLILKSYTSSIPKLPALKDDGLLSEVFQKRYNFQLHERGKALLDLLIREHIVMNNEKFNSLQLLRLKGQIYGKNGDNLYTWALNDPEFNSLLNERMKHDEKLGKKTVIEIFRSYIGALNKDRGAFNLKEIRIWVHSLIRYQLNVNDNKRDKAEKTEEN